jgi:aryl-alcohol dehydrogenase
MSVVTRLARTISRSAAARALHTSSSLSHAAAAASPSSPLSSGSLRIRASVARSAAGPLSLEPVMLRAPRSEEVLVRLVATGLCHTDVAVKERGLCAFPMVLGHEGAGIVEKVGNSVTGFKVGDHVLLSYASCGTCPHCLIGKPAYCFEHGSENFSGTDTGARGSEPKTRHTSPSDAKQPASPNAPVFGSFFRQSSFAEYALATENNMVLVDRKEDLAKLAPLGCGIQTGAGAVLNTLRPPVGSNIAVFGLGAVGLSAIMAARLSGCSRIVAIDRNAARLTLARELGATDTLQVTGKESGNEVVEKLKALAPSHGYGFSIDTSGNPHVLRSAFDLLNPLGVCGLIGGAAPGVEVKVDMLGLLPGKQLRGIIQGDSVSKIFLPQLISHHSAGRFPFDKMITYYDGLEQLNQAIEDVKDPQGKVIKPVVRITQQ